MRFLLTKLSHFFIFFLGLSVTAPFFIQAADFVHNLTRIEDKKWAQILSEK